MVAAKLSGVVASAADRTVPVVIVQISWDFWTVFWLFWIVAVPVGLFTWMTVWILRRYNRALRAREAPHEREKP